ncbi:MAG: 4-carboxymuconolactone decarboxylase [Bacteroidales bacterium]|jgi:4-carboxymuconolactone decarboxylase|nr:4-carboxymuconolactone decarboxylase [Bacteroidales bacterium]MDN5352417.1 4-carboxymuconolactone decarboxylase [Clostridiales bacterium]
MELKKLEPADFEFLERFEAFAEIEVINEPGMELDDKTRYMAILAALIGCQGMEIFRMMLEEALSDKILTPQEAKEVVYQAVAYLGIGKVYPFLDATNAVMNKLGIAQPLEYQETTTSEDRLEKGAQTQVNIFGEGMKDFWKGGHINRWLAANCFGDYYTRKGLDLKQREMITFCYLAAQGGCESQLTSHVFGNFRLGNDSNFLIRVISQCLPYIGYPRSLNAIACVNNCQINAGEK